MTHTEWAVETRTLDDGPYDRLDDGSGWSNRRGVKYTKEEAYAEVAKYRGRGDARVVKRTVSEWEPDVLAPWERPDGCFGHCEPEGWYAPCRNPHTKLSYRRYDFPAPEEFDTEEN